MGTEPGQALAVRETLQSIPELEQMLTSEYGWEFGNGFVYMLNFLILILTIIPGVLCTRISLFLGNTHLGVIMSTLCSQMVKKI